LRRGGSLQDDDGSHIPADHSIAGVQDDCMPRAGEFFDANLLRRGPIAIGNEDWGAQRRLVWERMWRAEFQTFTSIAAHGKRFIDGRRLNPYCGLGFE
jgi:hypothetical protein